MKQVVIRGVTDIPKACNWLSHWLAKGLEGGKAVVIKLSHETRSEAQNRHLWPLLMCFTKQKEFGGLMHTKESWKLILLSAYINEPSGIILGIHGEVINTNLSSKVLSKAQFSELIESIYAKGCEWGIVWSDPAMKIYEEFSQ